MKKSDILVLAILIGLLAFSFYLLHSVILTKPTTLKQLGNLSGTIEQDRTVYSDGTQFYQNMRYRDRKITYYIESNCTLKKQRDIEYALEIISNRTILTFIQTNNNPEIRYLCSNVAPEPEEEGHFVAGEGGPSEIINTSAYAVVFTGKVSLYRPETCAEPKISLHETLHALGFDHSDNPKSIMHPVTACDQVVDQYVIDVINDLYKADSLPDLGIDKVDANITGNYLNFNIVVVNYGLRDTQSTTLEVSADGEAVKEFDLKDIEIGSKKFLNVVNLRIPSGSEKIEFTIVSNNPSKEISLKNNKIELVFA